MRQSSCILIIKNLFIGICCFFLHSNSFAIADIEGIQIYQKNLHLFDERKQSLAEDIYAYHNADNMWDVLRSEFSLPHYEDNYQVQQQIKWFLNNQDFLLRAATRAAPYLYYISQQVRKRHLPAELVLLPMIESAYNPFVYSSAGAGGIWQIMPETASGLGVKQNWWYDGRRDVIASTKAALDYLVYLGEFFDGNWLLAIGAYNTGEGNVLAAIRKNIRDGKGTDFWSLPVHQQTREYVPRLLALASIIANADTYGIEFPAVSNAPYLAQVDVGEQIDLEHAASLAGLSLKALKQLNPGHNRTSTDPNGPFKIVLPIQNVIQFSENLMRSPTYDRVRLRHYKVRTGDTLLAIAKKYNTTPESLRKANTLSGNAVRPGLQLVIPETIPEISKTILASEKVHTPVKKVPAQNQYLAALKKPAVAAKLGLEKFIGNNYTLQPGDTLYLVRKGDTFDKVAARFHMSVKSLLAANNVRGTKVITPGSHLVIPTHFNTKQKYKLTPGDTIYMVRNGDSLDKIAKKFHTTPPEIRVANLLASNDIQEGDRLVIPTHG